MTTLTEVGSYLEDLGIATQATDLFLGSMPDEPDTVLVVYEYPGGAPEYVQEHFLPIAESVQLQVVARASKYEDAAALAVEAWQALAVVTNATLSGVKYRSIRPNSSPGIMRRDTNDRMLVFFNVTVEKEVTLAAS